MYAGDQMLVNSKKSEELPPAQVFAKKLFSELDKNGDGESWCWKIRRNFRLQQNIKFIWQFHNMVSERD